MCISSAKEVLGIECVWGVNEGLQKGGFNFIYRIVVSCWTDSTWQVLEHKPVLGMRGSDKVLCLLPRLPWQTWPGQQPLLLSTKYGQSVCWRCSQTFWQHSLCCLTGGPFLMEVLPSSFLKGHCLDFRYKIGILTCNFLLQLSALPAFIFPVLR